MNRSVRNSICSAAAALAFSAGCASTSVIYKFDDKGRVTERIETSESVVSQIIESTRNKTVYVWMKGWVAMVKASMTTMDDPFPIFRIWAGNVDKGVLTIPKELSKETIESLAKPISAIHSSKLAIGMDGIVSETASGEAK